MEPRDLSRMWDVLPRLQLFSTTQHTFTTASFENISSNLRSLALTDCNGIGDTVLDLIAARSVPRLVRLATPPPPPRWSHLRPRLV